MINILHNVLIAITNNSDDKFDSNNPLTFTAQEPKSIIRLCSYLHIDNWLDVDGLQYRTNINDEWSTYTLNTIITLTNVGDYIQFQNTKEQLSTSADTYIKFDMGGKITASGNIQSMLNYSKSCSPYCYYKLFYGCTSLTKAPELPATNLAEHCYESMFEYCSDSLTSAPELPATTLAERCYSQMFAQCWELRSAPELPATALAEYCYYYMFDGCTSLNYIKVGFTNWNDQIIVDGTMYWLFGVSETGTFVCPTGLDTTKRGWNYIPEGWKIERY